VIQPSLLSPPRNLKYPTAGAPETPGPSDEAVQAEDDVKLAAESASLPTPTEEARAILSDLRARAERASQRALELAPDNDELQFWAALSMYTNGREAEARPIFTRVFTRERRWAELLPRLAKVGLFPDDKAKIDDVVALGPKGRWASPFRFPLVTLASCRAVRPLAFTAVFGVRGAASTGVGRVVKLARTAMQQALAICLRMMGKRRS